MSAISYVETAVVPSRRLTRAIVDLGRLQANARAVRAWIGPKVALMAVIKAGGYGHGAAPVARAALDAGARWLGVACVDEGLALRAEGIGAPILVLGHSATAEAPAAIQGSLTLTLGTITQCEAMAAVARESNDPIRVHLKIDTGMGRFGILPDQIPRVVSTLRSAPAIIVEGCFTHLARGEEEPSRATDAQLDQFEETVAALRRRGIDPPLLHAANSGATVVAPRAHYSMVRAGLLIYGYRPDPASAPQLPLSPVMEVHSALVRVETLPGGSRIGYGHTHTLVQPTRVGLVPIGYADGLPRALSGAGYLVVGGQRVPIIGRVSMDQCSVDLTGVPSAREGDPVCVMGCQGNAGIWADDLAAWSGTVSYEILCGISLRVPRQYR
ncbi:MAG TPA: alanine racemase [Chloroflexota bacterium]|nr:alanine racemase [Chloroflexota bacterium]